MSADTKYYILQHHFKPGHDYTFPKGDDGRSFQHQWLRQFTWLVYSKRENAGYCLPCLLFSTSGYHGSEPGVLVCKPLTNFRKSLETLRKHIGKDHHSSSIVRRDDFLKVMTNQQPAITTVLNRAVADQIAEN